MENFLTIKETCEMLRITKATMYRYLKKDPTFPRPIQITKRKMIFKTEDIKNWLEVMKKVGRSKTNKSKKDITMDTATTAIATSKTPSIENRPTACVCKNCQNAVWQVLDNRLICLCTLLRVKGYTGVSSETLTQCSAFSAKQIS